MFSGFFVFGGAGTPARPPPPGCIGHCDGFIQFNFNFDFDTSNGTAANAFDFVGVAAHKLS